MREARDQLPPLHGRQITNRRRHHAVTEHTMAGKRAPTRIRKRNQHPPAVAAVDFPRDQTLRLELRELPSQSGSYDAEFSGQHSRRKRALAQSREDSALRERHVRRLPQLEQTRLDQGDYISKRVKQLLWTIAELCVNL